MNENIKILENLIFNKEYSSAKILLKKLLKQEKNNPFLYYCNAFIKLNSKKIIEALTEIKYAIALDKSVKNLSLQVHILFLLKNFKEAINVLDEIIKLDSSHALAYYFKGIANYKIDQKINAIKFYKIALKYQPNSIQILKDYVILLVELKYFKLAIKKISQIIILEKRNNHISLNDRGVLYLRIKEFDKAILDFEESIKIHNKNYFIFYNLAKVYFYKKNFDLALEKISISSELNPESDEVNLLMAEIYNEKKLPFLALEKIKKIKNKNLSSIVNLIYLKLELCDWSSYEKNIKELKNNINHFDNSILLTTFCSFLVEDNPLFQLEVAKNASKFLVEKIKDIKIEKKEKFYNITQNKKIRLGYVSADFNNHPMGHLLKSFFKNHNRDLFEVVAFNIGSEKNEDYFFIQIKNSFDIFVNCEDLSDEDLILKVRSMNIDIAIDLMGYTKNCRPSIFAKRIAPIQINYLGFPGTSGSDFFDYIIADEFIIPTDMKKFYTEEVLYMPDCYQINDDTKIISNFYKNKSDIGFLEKDFIYGCFNKNLKISPLLFNSWMNILKKTKDSKLWLYLKNKDASFNLLKEAKKFNIESDRIIFAYNAPLEQHLSRYKLIDLFLDTYPYTSHVTASDCLFSETPLLSICGKSFASRVSSSLLNSLGLNELITYSLNEYEDIAIDLYRNKERLKKLKESLIRNKKNSNLFNTNIKTRQIEDIYLKILKK